MRKAIEQIGLKLVRLYTYHTPVSKGKYRLFQTALKLCRCPPSHIKAVSKDGREFSSDLSSGMHESVYFLGEYEPAVTNVIRAVVRSGDVCLDVGANFGWFTTLFSQLSEREANAERKHRASVHAFEPMPDVFANLQQNWKLAGEPQNVFLNNLALGDEIKTVNLYRFKGLPDGFSSLSAKMKSDFQTFSIPMITLDSYLIDESIENVDFVKLDIEGAEMMFLRGATKLFRQNTPPIFIVEMALGTTKNFGYLPNDLIEFFRQHADYDFFALDEVDGTLHKIDGFAPEEIGANVLCVPKNCDPKRLKNLKFVE